MIKNYIIRKNGEFIESKRAPEIVGVSPIKIFGKPDCPADIWYHEQNKVFFHTIEDAIIDGYKPCRICEPMNGDLFERLKSLIPEKSLEEFYSRK